jgi:hypothetical protein
MYINIEKYLCRSAGTVYTTNYASTLRLVVFTIISTRKPLEGPFACPIWVG